MAEAPEPPKPQAPPALLPMLVVERGLPAPVAMSRRFPGWVKGLRLVPLAMALMLAGGVIGLYFQPPGLRKVMGWLDLSPGGGTANPIAVPPQPRSGPDPLPGLRIVLGLGKLLPEGEVITVAPPYGASDARIARILVNEGDRVEAGALLGVLDNEKPLASAAESARANLAAKEASLAQVRNATQAGRAEAQAALARAEAVAQNAARDFERADELRKRGFAADQTFDQRRTQLDEARREVDRLRAALTRFGDGDLDQQADILVAARNVDLARADADRAQADLERAAIRAPRAGTILSITARPGEKPGAGGILNLGDIDHMKADVEVYQTEILRVALNAPVELLAEALPQPLKGRVARIGLEVAKQSLTDLSPAASTDARVIKVTVALDEASNHVARRFTNLQVRARILPPQ